MCCDHPPLLREDSRDGMLPIARDILLVNDSREGRHVEQLLNCSSVRRSPHTRTLSLYLSLICPFNTLFNCSSVHRDLSRGHS